MRTGVEPSFVLDASVTAVWAFSDEEDSYAMSVLEGIEEHPAAVPVLWLWEITNILLTAQRRGRISESAATDFLAQLNRLPILPQAAVPLSELPTLFALAGECRLTAYNAEYLMLAMEMDLPLATLDLQLLEAMNRVGVERYIP
jgi:predicted nucleic acid-binding protein